MGKKLGITNKVLSQDLDATDRYWKQLGYESSDNPEEAIKQLVPNWFHVKYIKKDGNACSGGFLIKIGDTYCRLKSNIIFGTKYENMKKVYWKKKNTIEMNEMSFMLTEGTVTVPKNDIKFELPIEGPIQLPVIVPKKTYLELFLENQNKKNIV